MSNTSPKGCSIPPTTPSLDPWTMLQDLSLVIRVPKHLSWEVSQSSLLGPQNDYHRGL